MRLSFCLCLAFLAAMPAAAQSTDPPDEGYYLEVNRVGFDGADFHHLRPYTPSAGVGQWRETKGWVEAGRRTGAWEYGLRLGWAEEAIARRVDPAGPFSLENAQHLELDYVTVGPSVAWSRPLGERLGLRVEADTWAGFTLTDGLSSAGLDGAGFRAMSTLGYRVGTEQVAVVPTVGLYGRLVHRFADEGVQPFYGGPRFPETSSASDLELGIRTALPLLMRLGGVTAALEPYVDWGSGTSSNGLRTSGGIGIRVGF